MPMRLNLPSIMTWATQRPRASLRAWAPRRVLRVLLARTRIAVVAFRTARRVTACSLWKQVFVIGGGNSACEETLFLSDIASSVTIVLRRDEFRAPEGVVNKVLAKDNISVRYQTSICELSGETMPTTITFKDNTSGKTHTETFEPGSFGIFVFTGTQPHTELVEHLVDLGPDGGILTDDSMATRTPGLFAVGDIRSKRLRQVVTAVSDGAIAATSAYAFLRG